MNRFLRTHAARIAFGVGWLVDATLKWPPGFRSGYFDLLTKVLPASPPG